MTIFTDSGETLEQLVYFVNDVGEFYLSKEALTDLKVISHDFLHTGLHNKGNINEVQDGFPSVVREGTGNHRDHAPPVPGDRSKVLQHALHPQGPTVDAPVCLEPGQRHVAPSPTSLPVPIAPCIPQGMTSLGSRTPAMEGCAQVRSGVEPGAPQRVEPQAPPDHINPTHMVTTLNSDHGHSVRVALPPVATKVKDAPEAQHHLSPSPLCLPPGPPESHRGGGVDPGGDASSQFQVQGSQVQGIIPPNIRGPPKGAGSGVHEPSTSPGQPTPQ